MAPKALQVAYINGGNVWLWREGGQAAQLIKGGEVADVKISPDGAIVAFERGKELWAVNADGAQERRLVSAADLAAVAAGTTIGQFAWQPGSHRLAYNTGEFSIYGWAPDSQHLAFLAGPPGHEQALIGWPGTQAVAVSDDAPATVANLRWIDGSHYLFQRKRAQGRDLVLREIGGTDQVVATTDSDLAQVYDLGRRVAAYGPGRCTTAGAVGAISGVMGGPGVAVPTGDAVAVSGARNEVGVGGSGVGVAT